MIRKTYFNLSIALILMAGCVPAAGARQDQSGQPIPAYHSPLASVVDNGSDQDTDTQTLAPDTRALTGAENFSVGNPLVIHSYWQPSFNLSSSADSNAVEAAGNPGWTSWTSISAGLDLHRQSGTSNLDFKYLAGGMLSTGGAAPNELIQSLSFQERFTFRRSTLSFLDLFSYLPESEFGFAGLGGGVSLPGQGTIGSSFAPGQTALTLKGENLTNSFVTEFDESLTSRTSLTFVGGYSLLHETDSEAFNYNNPTFQAGYNHQMSPKDTIGLSDSFSAMRYTNSSQTINTNTVAVSYGRRVTGRLGFRVSGGPQVAFSDFPVTGGSEQMGTSSATRLYWSAQSSLEYQLRSTELAVNFSRSVTGGAGVLPGSLS